MEKLLLDPRLPFFTGKLSYIYKMGSGKLTSINFEFHEMQGFKFTNDRGKPKKFPAKLMPDLIDRIAESENVKGFGYSKQELIDKMSKHLPK